MKTELIDGIFYIQSEGYFNQELGQNVLKRCMEEMSNGQAHFLLDMQGSKMVNSIGISMLLEVIDNLRDIDGSLSFCNLAPAVSKSFQIMGIGKYAKVFDSKEEAMEALASS